MAGVCRLGEQKAGTRQVPGGVKAAERAKASGGVGDGKAGTRGYRHYSGAGDKSANTGGVNGGWGQMAEGQGARVRLFDSSTTCSLSPTVCPLPLLTTHLLMAIH